MPPGSIYIENCSSTSNLDEVMHALYSDETYVGEVYGFF